MAKTFFARGTDGVSCIYQGDSNVIDNPAARLQDVFFHSRFKYFKEAISGTTTVRLPSLYGASSMDSTIVVNQYTLATFNSSLTPIPMVWFTSTGELLVFAKDIISNPATDYPRRTFSITTNSTSIILVVESLAFNYTSLPEEDMSFSYLLGVVT